VKNSLIFVQYLAQSMHLYEYHLYSNYHLGANWFFQELGHLKYANGAGLLDFLIARPKYCQYLERMQTGQCVVKGLA
jgi:hypothetical protein